MHTFVPFCFFSARIYGKVKIEIPIHYFLSVAFFSLTSLSEWVILPIEIDYYREIYP